MYYDDEARQFNFVSGLLLGAILGTGLALLAAPQRRSRSRPLRRTAAALRTTAVEQVERARAGLETSFEDARGGIRAGVRRKSR